MLQFDESGAAQTPIEHPAACLYPLLAGSAFESLVKSMREFGFDETHPVLRWRGQILDGRNRLRAAQAAGVKPIYKDLPDEMDPWLAAWRANGERRDLAADVKTAIYVQTLLESGTWQEREQEKARQRAQAQSAAAASRPREDGHLAAGPSQPSRDGQLEQHQRNGTLAADVAKEVGVSPSTVERVVRLRKADPEAFERVKRGETTANKELKRIAKEKEQEQEQPSQVRSELAGVASSEDDDDDAGDARESYSDLEYTRDKANWLLRRVEPEELEPEEAVGRVYTALDDALEQWPKGHSYELLMLGLRNMHARVQRLETQRKETTS